MSNTKREEQKKNRELAIKKAKRAKSIKVVVIVLCSLLLVGLIGWAIAAKAVTNVKPVSDFSAGLNSDGTIHNVRALDYVDLCDYKNITVNKSELEVSDEEYQSYIEKVRKSFPEDIVDENITIKEGDTINFDYLGKIDGIPFDGGSTNGQGTDAVMDNPGGFIPGFTEQIIGHNVGETFDIYVTFPENYAEELSGKEAVFTITINSYVDTAPEFNDAFVEKNLSDIALTAKGFEKYYKDLKYQQALYTYLQKFVVENSSVKDYPKDYLKILKGQLKYDDEQSYAAENNTAIQNTGKPKYSSFNAYIGGMSDKEYVAFLSQQATKQAESDLIYQAILEDAGITIGSEDVAEYLVSIGLDESYYSSSVNTYGRGYVYHQGMVYTVIKYLADVVNVVE